MAYNIFLSYRRKGGYETAKHLYDLLVYDGYTVSFDIDTLRSGDFDNELLKRIDECTDFIVILNKDVFDRCFDTMVDKKQDWLRNELAYAIKKKKNIVPIMLDGFTAFPDNLPADIADVARKNSPKYDQYYFDDFYRRLKETFLETPPPIPVAKKNKKNKIILLSMLVTLLFVSSLLLVWKLNRNSVETTLSFITPQDTDVPTNIMQSIQPKMSMQYIEEHFGKAKSGGWIFKNMILEISEDNGKIVSVTFRTKANLFESYDIIKNHEINIPWDNTIAKYKIPNFGIATFGNILDKLGYNGENISWMGDLKFNCCIADYDFGNNRLASNCEEYINLTIGPDKSTNFKTYILSTDDWWYDAKNKHDECKKIEDILIATSEEGGEMDKDFSVLNKEEYETVIAMIKNTKITSLTIK